ncbi:MAG: glycosyltransferase family 87 protein [Terracidiphilus sp.]
MNELPRDHDRTLTRRRAAALCAFFALNLIVYLIRIVSVWRYGSLFCPTAAESPMIDSVWRVMHHRTLYPWPFAPPFSLTLYNFLFYDVYAAVLNLIGAVNGGILTWGRQLTVLFALAGALAQWRLVRGLLHLRNSASALSLAFAVGLWLCTSLIKYWALVIRPDVAAAALVMIALWMVARQPRFCFAYAGVLLYLAWAFKQSVVLTLVALCLWLALNKRWRDLALVAGVFAVLVAVTLLLGTPEYRFSILVAPRMVNGFAFGMRWILHTLGTGLTAVALNLFWVAAPLVLIKSIKPVILSEASWGSQRQVFVAGVGERSRRTCVFFSGVGAENLNRIISLLTVVFAVALIVGLAGMGKVGATSNYLFDAFIAGSTLLQIAVFTVPGRLVTALLFLGCVQPAVQIAGVAVGYHHQGKRDRVSIATAVEFAQASALRDRLALMPKPIFTTDEAFQLPWISTDGGAAAFTFDPNFQDAARSRDQNGGVEGMLQRGEIPTVVLAPSDQVYLKSLNPHYRKAGESNQQGVPYTLYEFDPGPLAPSRR